jgi:hypothetical protein
VVAAAVCLQFKFICSVCVQYQCYFALSFERGFESVVASAASAGTARTRDRYSYRRGAAHGPYATGSASSRCRPTS